MAWSSTDKKCASIIQKNSAFKAVCEESSYASLPPRCGARAEVACGTKVGSGDLRAYCIDEKDVILETMPQCESITTCRQII